MADAITVSYDEGVEGWPSFYSFLPDFMIGMNGFFYSWNQGKLYRHNTNETRNNYYGVQFNSTITGVINIEPKTIKLFKTMSYESDDRWGCTSLFTDLGTGSMLSTYFVQKEGEWFTFLRENEGTKNFKSRSVNGIAACTAVGGVAAATTITFANSVGSIISVGDYIYATASSVYTGEVTAVDQATNTITVDTTVPEPVLLTAGTIPAAGDFIFFLKDPVAESHGARGYFMQFTLENTNTKPIELFAVGSSVMKSYP